MMLYIKYFYYVRLQSLLEESILSTYSCDPCGSPQIYMYIHICKCVYACMYAYRMVENEFFIFRCCKKKRQNNIKERQKRKRRKKRAHITNEKFDIEN